MPISAGRSPWRFGYAALGWLWLLMGSATAASLQVAPTSLQLTPRQNADALWLTNSGTAPVQVQVRVFEWRQDTGQDQLLPTTDLQVSPPMQSLAAGQQQLIRVVRSVPEAPASQRAYRVIVDELPTVDPRRTGMQFVLRYSMPVFVQPGVDGPLDHALQVRLTRLDDGRPALEVHNRGNSYAQLADIGLGPVDRPQIIHPGLLGYVLGGQTMRWPLDVPVARLAGATFSAKINGESAQTPLPAAPPAR
jgi:fimbrial chaperone protein